MISSKTGAVGFKAESWAESKNVKSDDQAMDFGPGHISNESEVSPHPLKGRMTIERIDCHAE
jgi:hypothetical protein